MLLCSLRMIDKIDSLISFIQYKNSILIDDDQNGVYLTKLFIIPSCYSNNGIICFLINSTRSLARGIKREVIEMTIFF